MKLGSRPATADDVRLFYPEVTASFRAMVCTMDGEPQGIIGIALTRPVSCLFSVVRDPLRPYLKSLTVLRLIKWVQGIIETSRVPVRAIAEPTEATADGILRRMGFSYVGRFDDDEIYEHGGRMNG